MSISQAKGKERMLGMEPWSQWTWDAGGFRWYRRRLQLNGSYEYEFQAAYETPTPGAASLTEEFARSNINTLDTELDPRFQIISSPSRFFRMGRVFKTLWTEPAGNVSEDDSKFVIAAKFGEKAYSKIRYFVVIREMQGCCLCLPLNTYGFQGAGKQRIRVEDYAAVYPSGTEPPIQGGDKMIKDPFPIIIEDSQERLSPMSRLNFGRVYTVEHNTKALKVGRIPKEFLAALDKYFIERIVGTAGTKTPRQQSHERLSPPPSLGQSLSPEVDQDVDAEYEILPLDNHNAQDTSSFNGESSLYAPLSRPELPNPYTDSSYYPPASSFLRKYNNSLAREQSDLDYTSYLPSIDTASPGTFEMPKDNVPYKGAGASDTKHPIKTKVIMATKGVNEVLDPNLKIHSSKYFKRFHSFKLLWPEPRGGTRHPDAIEGSYPGNYGEPIHYSVQRFIIVASSDGHCQCVPIISRPPGNTKRGGNISHEAIAYTTKDPPSPFYGEAPGYLPIQIIPNTSRDKLSVNSRINYAKIYTVEHNVKVSFTGRIAPKSEARFLTDFDGTWSQRASAA